MPWGLEWLTLHLKGRCLVTGLCGLWNDYAGSSIQSSDDRRLVCENHEWSLLTAKRLLRRAIKISEKMLSCESFKESECRVALQTSLDPQIWRGTQEEHFIEDRNEIPNRSAWRFQIHKWFASITKLQWVTRKEVEEPNKPNEGIE